MKEENRYKKILRLIYRIMGPKVPLCIGCKGCSVEWSEVLSVLREVLGIKAGKLFEQKHKEEKSEKQNKDKKLCRKA